MPESQPFVHDPLHLRVSVAQQTMDVIQDGTVVKTYPISTSKFGLGTVPDSYCTPTGRFRVAQKIGDNAPLGAVFKGRQATGEIASPGGDDDLILTRILWLDGLDPENRNTHSRYIYLHGTNQEAHLGRAASHGCVRMANSDIAELFSQVPEGTLVEITV